MMARLPLPAFVQRLQAHIRARPDTEFQQALIRLSIVVGFYLYFSFGGLMHSPAIDAQVHILGLGLSLISLSLLIGSLIDTGTSVVRRGFGMLHDFTVATYMLSISNETGAPIVAIYLWVTLGNGFRYGVPYLFVSTIASAIGFGVVYHFNPFWHSHTPLWLGMLVTLIVIPLYASSLLRQLHGAVKREQEASQAKSNFLANMSHELRTPLNGVIGVSDLLAETRLDKEQKELTRIIRTSANTLLDLIESVLDISRIEAGRILTESEDFDLHRLVNGTVGMMEHQARGKGLGLAPHIAPQTPFHLHGDARHLRQILINLIGNAIKFTESGRVDVYVRPVGQSHQPQRVRFEVVDTGIGIPEAAQARIFDSFTQADPSITRRFGGSGLGTTIARQLVETMGGQIGLHSREGEGTTFWFELPFALQAADHGVPETQFDMPMRVAILASGELSVRLQTMIHGWGAESVLVGNTVRLAAELSTDQSGGSPFGAVVVERSALPDDPVALLRRLHNDPGLATLPLILIESDTSTSPTRDQALEREGYAAVLRTPVNATLLFNAIHAAVSHEMPANVVSMAQHLQAQGGSALRILVAEDNPVNQRVIRGLLEHSGHTVHLARDGEEALAMLEAGDPAYQLAIVDMHMPQLSGPEVVKRWRFMERGRLPIIMLTADARTEAQAACEAAGVDAFLTKPVNGRELAELIGRLTGQQTQTGITAAREARHADDLDRSVLDELALMGGNTLVEDLLASFEEDSQRAVQDIEHALATQNYGLWNDQLHMLKGGARDIGAHQLAQRCAEAERIKPFEFASSLAQERLQAVDAALGTTQTALAAYQANRLSAEGA
jgi:two-component system, sensor histidine kinase RpfC